jgi:hypothetical protein
MNARALHVVDAAADFADAQALLNAAQRRDVALSDMFTRVFEEMARSRANMPAILMPGEMLHAAFGLFLRDLRACADDASRRKMRISAAVLAAIALRLATEGTPVWPDTLPDRKPDLRERAGR